MVWVSRERLVRFEDEAGHLTGAPELVVEVLSAGIQDAQRDREAKRKLYSERGVEEYWIVDRFAQCVEVYRRKSTLLVLASILPVDATITSALLPGFELLVARLFGSEANPGAPGSPQST